ncbi:MAG: prephenate dehydrogenase/arogenate dehydrogenase family protein [Betaproteobacteria bacterium]|nr:MAG: prephenate dehydrogenase/arogenate dehydrogenase family protein [Betaproteobacteria bacterium]
MAGPRLDKVVIFGVGLIGGSFALGLKAAGAAKRVIGLGRTAANLEHALELGVIDEASDDPAVVVEADLVLIATPVGQMGTIMEAIAPHLGADTVVTDGGSTKQDVVALAYRLLNSHAAQFVPGHPIAGAEYSGVAAARADLYRQRKVVLTPLPENSERSIRRVRAAWRLCGAKLFRMRPAEHDRVFAAVSHLPHLLSYALVDQVARHPNGKQLFDYAAGGFRDFTRVASSHPEMWRDICVANRKALLQELTGYQRELAEMKQLLQKGDAAGLEKIFTRARAARNKWLKKQQ